MTTFAPRFRFDTATKTGRNTAEPMKKPRNPLKPVMRLTRAPQVSAKKTATKFLVAVDFELRQGRVGAGGAVSMS
jgi:hypothetical protein